MKKNSKLILLISPCRSGSTALLYSFSQIPKLNAYYQPIKGTIRENKKFKMPNISKDTHIFKETLGHENIEICSYNPNDYINGTEKKTIFLFREPVYTYNSWKQMGWNPDIDLFIKSYQTSYNIFRHNQNHNTKNTTCLILEDLVNGNCKKTLKKLCEKIDLPYNDRMIYWGHNADIQNFIFLSDVNKKVALNCSKKLSKAKGLHKIKIEKLDKITEEESDIINKKLSKKYETVAKIFKEQYC